MSDVAKGMILYIVSPIDVYPGPIDDLIIYSSDWRRAKE